MNYSEAPECSYWIGTNPAPGMTESDFLAMFQPIECDCPSKPLSKLKEVADNYLEVRKFAHAAHLQYLDALRWCRFHEDEYARICQGTTELFAAIEQAMAGKSSFHCTPTYRELYARERNAAHIITETVKNNMDQYREVCNIADYGAELPVLCADEQPTPGDE